jgi:response regulator of citrate/malate metabolism
VKRQFHRYKREMRAHKEQEQHKLDHLIDMPNRSDSLLIT